MLEQRVMLSASPIAPAALETIAANNDSASPTSLVFVDSSVPQTFELAEEVKQLGGSDQVRVVFLDSDKNGIEQIDDVISKSENIESVHIFSHGNQNGVQLGSTWLNQETISPYASTLVGWRDSLTADADLLIYGCDLAAEDSGQQLLESIAELTQADVAASDDLTGHSTLGGDWELEYQVGLISSTLDFSQSFQDQWHGLLETLTFQEGLNGYQDTSDTFLQATAPDDDLGSFAELRSDGGISPRHALIKFENIFGSGPNQIPFGSTIQDASLVFQVSDTAVPGQTITIHEMLSNWEESSTWNSLNSGVSQDGNESAATPDASVDGSATTANFTGAGITQTIQGWSDGDTNHGWVILNSDAIDIWQVQSSESPSVAQRPQLQIEFTAPAANAAAATPLDIPNGIWLSTRDDVNNSGVDGIPNWTDGTVLQLADPNLSLGPGTSSGTFSTQFNLDDFTDGDTEVQGMHFVSRNITVGGTNAIDLKVGDVLLSTNSAETVVSNNTLAVAREDIFVFRPDTVGDYSSGSFFTLFENIEGRKLHAFTLVEQDTRIGTTDVAAGDVLLSVAGDYEFIYWFRTTDVGEGTTSGTIEILIDGEDINLDEQIQGIELLENDTTIGGTTFSAGGLIVTANNNVTIDGLSVDNSDLVYLNFTQDSLGGSTAQANATMFLDGSDVGFNTNREDIHSFSLAIQAPTVAPNSPPTAVNDSYRVDQGGTLSTIGGQWFDNAWASRQEIQINNSTSSSEIIDQPLLVVLENANFDYPKAQAAGQDLRFVDANGALLDFEIASWNPGGQSNIWVNVPRLDAGSSASIWMYYDNDGATDGQSPGAVWSNDYLGVYHFDSDILDSSNKNNDPTSSSTTTGSGQIGGGQAFDGDSSFINLGTNSSVDNIFDQGGTVSAWVNLDSYGQSGFGRIFDKADNIVANKHGWSLSVDNPDGKLTFEHAFDGQIGRWQAPAGAISLSTWHHLTLTFEGSSGDDPRLFVDGVEVSLTETRTPSGNATSDSGLELAIGNHLPNQNRGLAGRVDEVRIVDRVLTQEEIALQFQNTSTGLTTLSPIETRTAPTGALAGDFDADGDLLTVTRLTDPSHGSLTLSSDGSFVYTHDGSENFTDSFTYQVSDGRGGIDSGTVNITINDVNDSPTLSLANETNSLSEDASTANRIKVADIVVDDDTAGTNTLSISGADAASFEIIGDELFLRAGVAIDFETQPAYSILIDVDDPNIAGTPEDQASYTLNITNVNEAPSVSLTNTVANIAEDADTSSEIRIADIVVTDDNSGLNNLSLSGTDAAQFVIVGNELRLRSGTTLNADVQTQYDVTVNVSDPSLGGSMDSASFTLTIENVNSNPTVDLSNEVLSLPEDADTSTGIRVADIVISDDTSGSNTLSLSGADAAQFQIIGAELWLRANTTLDFETMPSLDVTVLVSDTTLGSTDSVDYNLAIDDVNESPALTLANETNSLSEDASTVTRIKVADIVVDDDTAGTNTLSISGADAASFEIIGDELFLRADVAIDFETQPTYSIVVNVDDASIAGTPEDQASYTLNITNVNEAPSVSLANTIANIAEDADTSSEIRIADIVVADDGSGSNSLSLSGTDAAQFQIVGAELWMRANTQLDFETKPSLDVTISVSDTTLGSTDSVDYNLAIDDINESPTSNAPPLIETFEDAGAEVFDLSNWFADQDSADATLSYSIQNPPANWIEHRILGPDRLKLHPAANANGTTQIIVRATDSNGKFIDSTVMIKVAPVNDTISLTNQEILTESETSVRGRFSKSVVDADGETLDFIVVAQPQNGELEVSPGGFFRFTPNVGFSGRDSFQVIAQDGVAASNPAIIEVFVADAIAPPPSPTPVESETTQSSDSEDDRLPVAAAPDGTDSDEDEIGFVPPLRRPGLNPSFGREAQPLANDESAIDSNAEAQSTEIASFVKFLKAGSKSAAIPVSYATASSTMTTATQLTALSQPGPMWQQLDKFQNAIAADASLQKFTIGSVGTASSSLVVGYVIWALRSGVLMSSLMATMPAWNLLDPLAIMSVAEQGAGDGESLEDIVETQKQKLSESN